MPKLAVSNIAWSTEEDSAALDLISRAGIRLLEVAPTRIWQLDGGFSPELVQPALVPLRSRGIEVSGFQAILFGKPDLALFNDASRGALLEYLKDLARICSNAGGQYLVFGAPKNRHIPAGMDREWAFEIAGRFFHELGSHALGLGVKFGIEANPTAYGCNFCTSVDEAALLVRAANSAGISWHLDTGELAMNSENAEEVILRNADILGSVHVSQPHLGDFSSPWTGHTAVAQALRECKYDAVVSLEMKREEPVLDKLAQAVDFLVNYYA